MKKILVLLLAFCLFAPCFAESAKDIEYYVDEYNTWAYFVGTKELDLSTATKTTNGYFFDTANNSDWLKIEFIDNGITCTTNCIGNKDAGDFLKRAVALCMMLNGTDDMDDIFFYVTYGYMMAKPNETSERYFLNAKSGLAFLCSEDNNYGFIVIKTF